MDIALYRYSLPFTEPLTFHQHKLSHREGLLLKWDKNWSEIAPLPGFSKETLHEAQEEAIAFLEAFKKGKTIPLTLPSVQFGFDCARHQWPELKHTPLAPYLLLQGNPTDIVWNWQEWLYDYPQRVKLKLGRYPMHQELAMVRELYRLAPKTKFILDVNQNWNREEAWTFLSQLEPSHIEYVEDPCQHFKDVYHVATHTGISVALDEILSTDEEWEFFPQLKALVLKPMLIGSLDKCKALVDKAKANQVKVVLSSSHESQVGNKILAQLAMEWSPEQPPGLDTLRFLAESIVDKTDEPDLDKLKVVWQS